MKAQNKEGVLGRGSGNPQSRVLQTAQELGHSQPRLLEDRVRGSKGGTEETFMQLLTGETQSDPTKDVIPQTRT